MKWINLFTIMLGISLFLSSCKDKTSDNFFAGKIDDVFFVDFEPDKSFPPPNNKDSIDINQDPKYEFFFETVVVAGQTGFFTLPVMRATQDLNILISGKDNMPSALPLGEIINNSGTWVKTDTLMALYYYKYITPEYDQLIGFWENQKDKYLGIKYKNKLGWIKISTTPGYWIKEIALEK